MYTGPWAVQQGHQSEKDTVPASQGTRRTKGDRVITVCCGSPELGKG